MKLLVLYSVLGTILSAAADGLGAGMGLTLFVGLIGPPLLHFLFLALRLGERFG